MSTDESLEARASEVLRRDHTTAERIAEAQMAVDPGFVHHRKIEALLGKEGVDVINSHVRQIPMELPDHVRQLQIDHIYARQLLSYCTQGHIPSLSRLIAEGDGTVFCSVEQNAPTPGLTADERATTRLLPRGETDVTVDISYTVSRVVSDTTKYQLSEGSTMAVVALLSSRTDDHLTFEPLLMGGPIIEPAAPGTIRDASWLGLSYGEIFPEDIDEFSKLSAIEVPDDIAIMENISEHAVKTCIAEILGVEAPKDWGGEQSDLYTGHLHIAGSRFTAAFLLKGPARFAPMGLNHLGKNNDQILRLSQEPARLLIVQHAHEISQQVRSTLKAFTVQPGTLDRRYCLIDGRDTLRILTAYGKVDHALELSQA